MGCNTSDANLVSSPQDGFNESQRTNEKQHLIKPTTSVLKANPIILDQNINSLQISDQVVNAQSQIITPPKLEIDQLNLEKEEKINDLSLSHKILPAILEGNEDEYYGLEDIKHAKQTQLSSIIIKQQAKIIWTPSQQIGQGSFGTVIMGMNKSTGKVMAVKQVELTLYNLQADAEKIQCLEIEINLLSRMQHKNIVQYIGTERTPKHMNIFLEYVAGGSLQSVLQKFGKFKESLVKVYMIQILEGLIYLHDHGVIHRDIKSANILVDSVGVCKLADFGSSKKLTEIVTNDKMRSIQGTPNYMAPEVVLQNKSGRKSDIWSLGCTMIELLTGKPPWHNLSNAITIMIKIARTQEPPELPENLTQEAKDFLFYCLQIDPNKRWTAHKLLAHKFLIIPSGDSKASPRRQSSTHTSKVQNHQLNLGASESKNINLLNQLSSNIHQNSPAIQISSPTLQQDSPAIQQNQQKASDKKVGSAPIPSSFFSLLAEQDPGSISVIPSSSKKDKLKKFNFDGGSGIKEIHQYDVDRVKSQVQEGTQFEEKLDIVPIKLIEKFPLIPIEDLLQMEFISESLAFIGESLELVSSNKISSISIDNKERIVPDIIIPKQQFSFNILDLEREEI